MYERERCLDFYSLRYLSSFIISNKYFIKESGFKIEVIKMLLKNLGMKYGEELIQDTTGLEEQFSLYILGRPYILPKLKLVVVT